MLVCDSLNRPDQVWEKTWHWLSDGILHKERITTANPELQLSNDTLKNLTLSEIEDLLLKNRRSLKQFPSMPYPDAFATTNCGSDVAHLLRVAHLIIWDEAPMAHKFCFEDLDRTLKDIMKDDLTCNSVFGGKVVVFGGDFRQIIPVIPRGSRSDIVHATINASYLWNHYQVLTLSKNMRLMQSGLKKSTATEIEQFSDWIVKLGDGKLCEPNDGVVEIEIPHEFLIIEFSDPLQAIVDSTYPELIQNYSDKNYLKSRAILASRIETVDEINDYILSLIPGEPKEYLSADSIDKSDNFTNDDMDVITLEFLNLLTISRLPSHNNIKLKIGSPIMLLRNLDQFEGLCNGTRLIITRLVNHVIGAKPITVNNNGNEVYIPRISMSPSQSPWPFKLIRRQFPIMLSYTMTINKSQGQSLGSVGLYLPTPVFSHGQLYVVVSRVQSKSGLKILIHDKEKRPLSHTTNVVFKEVFQNV
ncbi:ATP-dependent DNA helicase PIF1-like [Vigna unguiculata]|uniref:ATP-dependent DNA helicase PIF1-like n=1 Tax=Vigna unguiculata TaxID=3917 RepID=UPI00101632BE|nr:ATP-dependent DNA helicase PIF1-like [Vigna unguiculata]